MSLPQSFSALSSIFPPSSSALSYLREEEEEPEGKKSAAMADLQRLVLFLLCVFMLGCCAAEPETYTVGGAMGWTLPGRNGVNYTKWASEQTFKVGDMLVFKYAYKAHNVLEVTRTDFRYCNVSSPKVVHDDKSNRTVVTLANPGNYYFIDGLSDHCSLGQKFQATVLASSAEAPAPAPSSGGAMPPASSAAPRTTPPLAFRFAAAALFLCCFLLRV